MLLLLINHLALLHPSKSSSLNCQLIDCLCPLCPFCFFPPCHFARTCDRPSVVLHLLGHLFASSASQ